MSAINAERVRVVECAYCHREFYAGRSDTHYCSKPCSQADWYRKQVEQREQQQ